MSDVMDDVLSAEKPSFAEAVKAVITGDVQSLRRLLADDPSLAKERSISPHRATLLHYTAANGVEIALQYQVVNADEVAEVLLAAGAEADAVCNCYDRDHTTLELLVSSEHPYAAGATAKVVKVLCAFGAAIDGRHNDGAPLATALLFGNRDGVDALIECGARTDNPVFAAAAGDKRRLSLWINGEEDRFSEAAPDFFPLSPDRKIVAEQALVFASMCGRVDVARQLIESGVDVNASPPGSHWTATPLHAAAIQGERDVVDLLLAAGADPSVRDKRYGGRPIDWLKHARPRRASAVSEVEKLLLARG